MTLWNLSLKGYVYRLKSKKAFVIYFIGFAFLRNKLRMRSSSQERSSGVKGGKVYRL